MSIHQETGATPDAPGIQTQMLPTKRVQLMWPSRGLSVAWQKDGWRIVSASELSEEEDIVAPLLPETAKRPNFKTDPWYLIGDPMETLDALRRSHGRRADLIYIDMPRLETNAAKFSAADVEARLDTWLTLVISLLQRSSRLLADQGALAVLCGINETPYVEILLRELFGPQNHIGTVAWQKGYSPRNMENMRDFSPTHDNIVVFSRRKESIPPVHLIVPAEGFKNRDSDPRGPWNAEQKGANKPDCNYEINICPYRWRIAKGKLPPGIWRISPKTGVIWGRGEDIVEAGSWKFTIEVSDRSGNIAEKEFEILISDEAQEPPLAEVPWLSASNPGVIMTGGKLTITTPALPHARVGAQYSVCVLAEGGEPWVGTTRPGKTSKQGKGRYWEFPIKTLLERAATDSVDFKQKDDAIPALKSYLGSDNTTYLNQMTVWLGRGKTDSDAQGVGYAQDAKKELSELHEKGVIGEIVGTSKPASLMARLIALFTRENSCVVDIGSPAGEMASVATACGRRVVYVEWPEAEGRRNSTILPRITIASKGEHPIPNGVVFSRGDGAAGEEIKPGCFLVRGSPRKSNQGGSVAVFSPGQPFLMLDRRGGVCQISYDNYPAGEQGFLAALASVEGLVPVAIEESRSFAESIDGRIRAVYAPSSLFLDAMEVESFMNAQKAFVNDGGRLRIYYHRGLDSGHIQQGLHVELRRLPFSLTAAAGLV